MSRIKFKITPLQILFLFLFAATAFIVIYEERAKVKRRINDAAYADGVIIEKGKRAKSDHYVKYAFKVDTAGYTGEVAQRFCRNKKKSCCEIGSKVKVRYEKGDPSNNDLMPGCP